MNTDQNSKRNPRGGWKDDEEDPKIKAPSTNNQIPSFIKKESQKDTTPTIKSDKKEPEKIVKSINIDYELKLIDDILKPTGITIKPSDNQLSDFIKKLRTLNKDTMSSIIIERIKNYENMNDQTQIKTLMKALFVIEYILAKKVEGYQQIFNEKLSLFQQINEFYISNKKVSEIVNSIITILNVGEKPKPQIITNNVQSSSSNNINLLFEIDKKEDIKTEFSGLKIVGDKKESSEKLQTSGGSSILNNTNSNNTTNEDKKGFIFIKGKKTEPQTQTTNVVNSAQNSNINNNQNNEFFKLFDNNMNNNLISSPNDINSNSSPENHSIKSANIEDTKKGGFAFINKNKVTTDSKPQNTPPPQKTTDFNTLKDTLTNKIDLDVLYSENRRGSNGSNHGNPLLFPNNQMHFNNNMNVPNQYNVNYQNIYTQNNMINYNQNYNLNHNLNLNDLKPNSMPLDFNNNPIQSNLFMNNNTNLSENIPQQPEKKEKDHFDFVNQMMKKK